MVTTPEKHTKCVHCGSMGVCVQFGGIETGKLLNNTSRGGLGLWELGRGYIWLQHRCNLALVHRWPGSFSSIVFLDLKCLVQFLSPEGVMRREREVIGRGQAIDLLLW